MKSTTPFKKHGPTTSVAQATIPAILSPGSFTSSPKGPTRTFSAPAAVVNALLSPLTSLAQPKRDKRGGRHREDEDHANESGSGERESDHGLKSTWLKTSLCDQLSQHIPILSVMRESMNRIPPKYKYCCFLCWLSYKLVSILLVVWLVHDHVGTTSTSSSSSQHHFSWLSLRTEGSTTTTSTVALESATQSPLRVLYIVTSLAEFNNGRRNTIAGQDRLAEVVLPVLIDSVESITTMKSTASQQPYQVDVYLILAYSLRPERLALIRNSLPDTVGLEVWDDACPLGYDLNKSGGNVVSDNTRTLARQHRYVIKDKLQHYDLVVAFEDDMRITGTHLSHYLSMSNELERLRLEAAAIATPVVERSNDATFFGPLAPRQWDRLIPGFVRVEVLLDETQNGAQLELDPIPLDYSSLPESASTTASTLRGGTTQRDVHFDPQPCCHVNMNPRNQTPSRPKSSAIVVWETGVKALAVRQLPTSKGRDNSLLDWVALLPGPGKRLLPKDQIGNFWSGRLSEGAWDVRPSPGQPDLIAQQGGWMATQQQILRWNQQEGDDENHSEEDHPQLCQGTFLPPFDEPEYRQDGQESMNVEFWSGGYQMFTGVKGGCNLQRVVSLHPDHFSKHFIYHVANNKQKQLTRERMVRADHLWGQLNSVKKAAQGEMNRLLALEQPSDTVATR